ncbi:hypothetical protein ABB37_01887 [Leptomonas pyrrhocoris]|uniref:Surface antigen-like protein n=1 Tax=Leptomonas pyrrhocoris TaxID=157538 RepID=A0A0N0VGM6_LEPPY|nr:hypothetical protein ABB37_01887 [Leptomonas pyrrhocoris]KPA83614.1 hypothetical protein ABB37_01887 [Leptomonas pyrrhocoris]|eukprot:XP_015662053.1 hypothetical protein ABB37_01887 [Leptomonas pyrrhocoris]
MPACRAKCSAPAGVRRRAASPAAPRLPGTLILLLASLLLAATCVSASSKHADPSFLSSTVGGGGGAYTLFPITGCGECTVNLSQRWCPSTMRCYPAGNCTCDGPTPCIDLRTCFYGSRPSCRECVDSGGVYCAGGVSAFTPHGKVGAQEVRCYPPESLPSPLSITPDELKRQPPLAVRDASLHTSLPTCGASTCRGGECAHVAADCPAVVSDPLTRSYEVICVVAVLFLSGLVMRNICRLLI